LVLFKLAEVLYDDDNDDGEGDGDRVDYDSDDNDVIDDDVDKSVITDGHRTLSLSHLSLNLHFEYFYFYETGRVNNFIKCTIGCGMNIFPYEVSSSLASIIIKIILHH